MIFVCRRSKKKKKMILNTFGLKTNRYKNDGGGDREQGWGYDVFSNVCIRTARGNRVESKTVALRELSLLFDGVVQDAWKTKRAAEIAKRCPTGL